MANSDVFAKTLDLTYGHSFSRVRRFLSLTGSGGKIEAGTPTSQRVARDQSRQSWQQLGEDPNGVRDNEAAKIYRDTSSKSQMLDLESWIGDPENSKDFDWKILRLTIPPSKVLLGARCFQLLRIGNHESALSQKVTSWVYFEIIKFPNLFKIRWLLHLYGTMMPKSQASPLVFQRVERSSYCYSMIRHSSAYLLPVAISFFDSSTPQFHGPEERVSLLIRRKLKATSPLTRLGTML